MKKTLLSLSLIAAAFTVNAQDCSELFISEYVEGSGNNKAFEIYNPTSGTIALSTTSGTLVTSNYRIVRYSNGSFSGADSTDLVGSIPSYSTFVIANGQTSGTASSPACSPTLQAMAQQLDHAYPAPTYANGDDAIVLVRISPYKIIDIFGEIGVQPTTAWSDISPYDGTAGKWWTKDHSLQRKSSVKQGVLTNPSPFIVTVQWDSLPKDIWTNVGIHNCACNPVGIKENFKEASFKVYPNPANGSELAFVSDKNIYSLVIVNSVGQVVYSHEVLNREKTLVLKDLNLTKGIYFITLTNEVGVKTEKISIQ